MNDESVYVVLPDKQMVQVPIDGYGSASADKDVELYHIQNRSVYL